jgi:hypothetical protein
MDVAFPPVLNDLSGRHPFGAVHCRIFAFFLGDHRVAPARENMLPGGGNATAENALVGALADGRKIA